MRRWIAGRDESEAAALSLDLADAVEQLTAEERGLWELMLDAQTVSEAARRLGKPRHRVSAIWKRVCRKLKRCGLADYFSEKPDQPPWPSRK